MFLTRWCKKNLTNTVWGCITLCCVFFIFYPDLVLADPRYGGHIVLSMSSDPKTFNGIINTDANSSTLIGLMFEGLTTTNGETLEVEPALAESWDVSEDGLQWTFKLRDAVWWDGQPITADDVVFTFNQLIYNPDIPSSVRNIFTIDGQEFLVEKIDAKHVRFTLPIRFAPFLRSMRAEIMPEHILQPVLIEGDFAHIWGINTPPEEIVGNGLFQLKEYVPGQRIVMERNPHYWKKDAQGRELPYVDQLIYLIVQNEDAALLKFMEGSLDVYGLRGMDYGLLKPKEKNDDFVIYDLGPSMGSNFVTFNQNLGVHPETKEPFVDPVKLLWFKDVQFRRAVSHAIDRERMVEIVKNGLGYPQFSDISPAISLFHNPDVPRYDYDPHKARSILKKAGYEDRDGDGIIEDDQGHPVKFTLMTNAGATERADMVGLIRHDLEQIGLDVNLKIVEFNTLVTKLTASFDWEAIVLGFGGTIDPHFGKNVWVSDGHLHVWYPRQESPATQWEKRIDDIFNEAVQELDEKKRIALYHEFQHLAAEQVPLIYTILGSKVIAVRNRLGNVKPTPIGGVLHNIEEIYIKK